jgi:hypothetical protein
VPFRKWQIHKICKKKSSVSDPDLHWFASNIFFTYEYYGQKSMYLKTVPKAKRRFEI